MKIFAGRVAANALAGGFAFALVGAICLGFGGWILGAALDRAGLNNYLNFHHYAADGADAGVALGAGSGIVGALIFGLAALQSAPRIFAPVRALFWRVALGQFLGVVGAATFFALYEYLNARWHGQRLASNVLQDVSLILWGAPVLMICGAIAAALTKRDLPQSATLNEE